jgi:hypothetical protein
LEADQLRRLGHCAGVVPFTMPSKTRAKLVISWAQQFLS